MLRSTTFLLMLALLTFLTVPAVAADVPEGGCAPGETPDLCVYHGPSGCHDYCGLVCVEGICAVCLGDPSYVGSDVACVVGGGSGSGSG